MGLPAAAALCFTGTLLALASASQDGHLQVGLFPPCSTTLSPDGPCESDGDGCPFVFNLPPMTVHLPKQLMDLQRLVEELQTLKDNVDELRRICKDCGASRGEAECTWGAEEHARDLDSNSQKWGNNERTVDEEMRNKDGKTVVKGEMKQVVAPGESRRTALGRKADGEQTEPDGAVKAAADKQSSTLGSSPMQNSTYGKSLPKMESKKQKEATDEREDGRVKGILTKSYGEPVKLHERTGDGADDTAKSSSDRNIWQDKHHTASHEERREKKIGDAEKTTKQPIASDRPVWRDKTHFDMNQMETDRGSEERGEKNSDAQSGRHVQPDETMETGRIKLSGGTGGADGNFGQDQSEESLRNEDVKGSGERGGTFGQFENRSLMEGTDSLPGSQASVVNSTPSHRFMDLDQAVTLTSPPAFTTSLLTTAVREGQERRVNGKSDIKEQLGVDVRLGKGHGTGQVGGEANVGQTDRPGLESSEEKADLGKTKGDAASTSDFSSDLKEVKQNMKEPPSQSNDKRKNTNFERKHFNAKGSKETTKKGSKIVSPTNTGRNFSRNINQGGQRITQRLPSQTIHGKYKYDNASSVSKKDNRTRNLGADKSKTSKTVSTKGRSDAANYPITANNTGLKREEHETGITSKNNQDVRDGNVMNANVNQMTKNSSKAGFAIDTSDSASSPKNPKTRFGQEHGKVTKKPTSNYNKMDSKKEHSPPKIQPYRSTNIDTSTSGPKVTKLKDILQRDEKESHNVFQNNQNKNPTNPTNVDTRLSETTIPFTPGAFDESASSSGTKSSNSHSLSKDVTQTHLQTNYEEVSQGNPSEKDHPNQFVESGGASTEDETISAPHDATVLTKGDQHSQTGSQRKHTGSGHSVFNGQLTKDSSTHGMDEDVDLETETLRFNPSNNFPIQPTEGSRVSTPTDSGSQGNSKKGDKKPHHGHPTTNSYEKENKETSHDKSGERKRMESEHVQLDKDRITQKMDEDTTTSSPTVSSSHITKHFEKEQNARKPTSDKNNKDLHFNPSNKLTIHPTESSSVSTSTASGSHYNRNLNNGDKKPHYGKLPTNFNKKENKKTSQRNPSKKGHPSQKVESTGANAEDETNQEPSRFNPSNKFTLQPTEGSRVSTPTVNNGGEKPHYGQPATDFYGEESEQASQGKPGEKKTDRITDTTDEDALTFYPTLSSSHTTKQKEQLARKPTSAKDLHLNPPNKFTTKRPSVSTPTASGSKRHSNSGDKKQRHGLPTATFGEKDHPSKYVQSSGASTEDQTISASTVSDPHAATVLTKGDQNTEKGSPSQSKQVESERVQLAKDKITHTSEEDLTALYPTLSSHITKHFEKEQTDRKYPIQPREGSRVSPPTASGPQRNLNKGGKKPHHAQPTTNFHEKENEQPSKVNPGEKLHPSQSEQSAGESAEDESISAPTASSSPAAKGSPSERNNMESENDQLAEDRITHKMDEHATTLDPTLSSSHITKDFENKQIVRKSTSDKTNTDLRFNPSDKLTIQPTKSSRVYSPTTSGSQRYSNNEDHHGQPPSKFYEKENKEASRSNPGKKDHPSQSEQSVGAGTKDETISGPTVSDPHDTLLTKGDQNTPKGSQWKHVESERVHLAEDKFTHATNEEMTALYPTLSSHVNEYFEKEQIARKPTSDKNNKDLPFNPSNKFTIHTTKGSSVSTPTATGSHYNRNLDNDNEKPHHGQPTTNLNEKENEDISEGDLDEYEHPSQNVESVGASTEDETISAPTLSNSYSAPVLTKGDQNTQKVSPSERNNMESESDQLAEDRITHKIDEDATLYPTPSSSHITKEKFAKKTPTTSDETNEDLEKEPLRFNPSDKFTSHSTEGSSVSMPTASESHYDRNSKNGDEKPQHGQLPTKFYEDNINDSEMTRVRSQPTSRFLEDTTTSPLRQDSNFKDAITTTTFTSRQIFPTTTSPSPSMTGNKRISSSRTSPDQRPKPGSETTPEDNSRVKHPKNDHKLDRSPSPDSQVENNQRQKHPKVTPGKVQIPRKPQQSTSKANNVQQVKPGPPTQIPRLTDLHIDESQKPNSASIHSETHDTQDEIHTSDKENVKLIKEDGSGSTGNVSLPDNKSEINGTRQRTVEEKVKKNPKVTVKVPKTEKPKLQTPKVKPKVETSQKVKPEQTSKAKLPKVNKFTDLKNGTKVSPGTKQPNKPVKPKTIPVKKKESSSKTGTTPSPDPETDPSRQIVTDLSTINPDSKVSSDKRSQTTNPTPSIALTTQTNKVPSTPSPSGGHSASSQTPPPQRGPGVRPIVGSTVAPGPHHGPKAAAVESTTPSARELRVKINQVTAFLNKSSSQPPPGRPLDVSPGEPKEDGEKTEGQTDVPTVRDCSDHVLNGHTVSGVYLVTPDPRADAVPVLCDMAVDGGGWTVLQRRLDGSVSFNRSWAEYRDGFGRLDGEFWLGNQLLHLLTRDRNMELRVELEDFDGARQHAQYEVFKVASERMRFRLSVGGYSGTAGDALCFSSQYNHNNRAFTTPDRDNDRYPSGNCGAYYSSGWWFDACMAANLNGRYYKGRYKGVRDGIYWGTWHNISSEYYPTNERLAFKTVTMMIRPRSFTP